MLPRPRAGLTPAVPTSAQSRGPRPATLTRRGVQQTPCATADPTAQVDVAFTRLAYQTCLVRVWLLSARHQTDTPPPLGGVVLLSAVSARQEKTIYTRAMLKFDKLTPT